MSELPSGWVEAPLSEIIQPRGEKVHPSILPDKPFIGMDHVEAHTTKILGSVPASTMKSSAARFYEGDVLYGRLRPYLNKVAHPRFDGLASAEFIVFPPTSLVDSAYLQLRLNASDFVNFASHLNEGDRPRVDFDQIGVFDIRLPPVNEQRRIVEKIETLFADLDAGAESLTRARVRLALYRQSVLKAAFEGRLTADWRTENPDKLEDPDTLLARIEKERVARHKQALDNWQEALVAWRANGEKGKKPAKPRRNLETAKPTSEQLAAMIDLPPSWQWLQIGSFAFVTKLAGFEYTDYVEYTDDGDLPVIKAENAGRFGFKSTDFSKVRSETVKNLKRSHLNGGELLMVFVGAGTGNVATVPDDKNYFLGPNIGMMRSESKAVISKYVEHFLRSPLGSTLKLATVKAVAQPSLSMGTIRQIPIAMPGTAEQAEIVQRLEVKLSNIDALEAQIDDGLARSKALRQSILKRAFAGKLVPQDPSDEPAYILLERIKGERNAKPKTKRRKKEHA